jgi:hypothetical protein
MPKSGVQRLASNSHKPAIDGPSSEYQEHPLRSSDFLAGDAVGFEPVSTHIPC